MGTIQLPTYQQREIDRPVAAAPRADLQGMAMLGNAQSNFLSNVFKAADFVGKLVGQAKDQERADEFSKAQRAYKEGLSNTFVEIEKNPISTRDPRYADIPEAERTLPNLSVGVKAREELYQSILGGIQDERVKQAFEGWAADRWISEKGSLSIKDIGWQREKGFNYFMDDWQASVDRGDVGGADDATANARIAGYITDDAKADQYRNAARMNVASRNAFLTAQGLGEAGMGYLTNPDNLKWKDTNGEMQDMALGEREKLIGKFKDALSWQEQQAQTQNGKINLAMSDAFVARLTGKGDPKKWLNYDMIDSAPWEGRQAGDEQQRWTQTLRAALDTPSGDGVKETPAQLDAYGLLAAKVYSWDRTKDPTVADSLGKEIVSAGTVGKSITVPRMVSLLEGLKLDPDQTTTDYISRAKGLFPTSLNEVEDAPTAAQNAARNGAALSDMQKLVNSDAYQRLPNPQAKQQAAQQLLDYHTSNMIRQAVPKALGENTREGFQVSGDARQWMAAAQSGELDSAILAGNKKAVQDKSALLGSLTSAFQGRFGSVDVEKGKPVVDTVKSLPLFRKGGIWYKPVFDEQSGRISWFYFENAESITSGQVRGWYPAGVWK